MNRLLIILMVLIVQHGCSKDYGKPITQKKYDRVITQGEFAGLKIGQAKREVLKSLALQKVNEVYGVRNQLQRFYGKREICSSEEMKGIQHGLLLKLHRSRVDQPNIEALRSLRKLINESKIIRLEDCIHSFWVNPQDIAEEEILFMSNYDLWNYFATRGSTYTDLYFSDDSLKKIEYHYDANEYKIYD